MTESSVELNKATQAVYDIAQKTYQSLDATAQVYQRFADNADRLGLSQQKWLAQCRHLLLVILLFKHHHLLSMLMLPLAYLI
ncbi:tape measure protein [Proteus vulgaris]|uniref:tape measure protein n=1 Tax=Proteus vulgaris TaxID=585 RepID=UPI0028A157F0|nr:tape measure protein [Proteus vulgaris]